MENKRKIDIIYKMRYNIPEIKQKRHFFREVIYK